jgi:hypothetical protein
VTRRGITGYIYPVIVPSLSWYGVPRQWLARSWRKRAKGICTFAVDIAADSVLFSLASQRGAEAPLFHQSDPDNTFATSDAANDTVEERPLEGRVASGEEEQAFRPRVPFSWNTLRGFRTRGAPCDQISVATRPPGLAT